MENQKKSDKASLQNRI